MTPLASWTLVASAVALVVLAVLGGENFLEKLQGRREGRRDDEYAKRWEEQVAVARADFEPHLHVALPAQRRPGSAS